MMFGADDKIDEEAIGVVDLVVEKEFLSRILLGANKLLEFELERDDAIEQKVLAIKRDAIRLARVKTGGGDRGGCKNILACHLSSLVNVYVYYRRSGEFLQQKSPVAGAYSGRLLFYDFAFNSFIIRLVVGFVIFGRSGLVKFGANRHDAIVEVFGRFFKLVFVGGFVL